MKSQFSSLRKEGLSQDRKAEMRKNLVTLMSEEPVSVRKQKAPRYKIARLFNFSHKSMTAIIIGLVAVLSMGSGVTYAAQNDIPGDVLYPIKRVSEDARLLLKTDKKEKADLELSFAERRSEELQKLLERKEVNPEYVKRTRDDFRESVSYAEEVARELKDTNPKQAIDLAVRADRDEDHYIATLGQIPEEYRDDFSELLQETVGHAHENGEEFIDMMIEVYEQEVEDEELQRLIQSEIQHELAEAKLHVDMLEQALRFAGTIDGEEARSVVNSVADELLKIQDAMIEIEAMIDSEDFDPRRIGEIIENEDVPDLEDLFEDIEDHFGGEEYEEYEYDGPWIDRGHDDPYAEEGECHPTGADHDVVECYEDGRWVLYDRALFEEEYDDERYDFPEYEDGYDEYLNDEYRDHEGPDGPREDDEDYRNGSYYDGETFHYDNEDDEFAREVEEIRAEYDKDGDGEVDCIGEEDCPDQAFFEQYFNRECDELCEAEHERMIREYDERIAEEANYDEERRYEEGEYDEYEDRYADEYGYDDADEADYYGEYHEYEHDHDEDEHDEYDEYEDDRYDEEYNRDREDDSRE